MKSSDPIACIRETIQGVTTVYEGPTPVPIEVLHRWRREALDKGLAPSTITIKCRRAYEWRSWDNRDVYTPPKVVKAKKPVTLASGA